MSERSQTPKTTYYRISFLLNVQNRQTIETESRSELQGLGQGERNWGVFAKGNEVSFWGD